MVKFGAALSTYTMLVEPGCGWIKMEEHITGAAVSGFGTNLIAEPVIVIGLPTGAPMMRSSARTAQIEMSAAKRIVLRAALR